ncbi:hypothetical protein PVL29_021818 [Vitis rotundifolia]|uniref:Uncharacterized protein n=1 Tax=Vitis rotundifolia TaxID=103349 RepID=A0AA38YU19_VITRO|nr:hypothetical protein PVL29_021818 [Vitis rotundifolia]
MGDSIEASFLQNTGSFTANGTVSGCEYNSQSMPTELAGNLESYASVSAGDHSNGLRRDEYGNTSGDRNKEWYGEGKSLAVSAFCAPQLALFSPSHLYLDLFTQTAESYGIGGGMIRQIMLCAFPVFPV